MFVPNTSTVAWTQNPLKETTGLNLLTFIQRPSLDFPTTKTNYPR